MFLDVVNSLPDAIFVIKDEDDVVEWANRAAGRLLRVESESLVGSALGNLLAGADISRFHGRLKHRNAAPFRTELLRPSDRSAVVIDARVSREHASFDGLYLVCAREVRQAGRTEELLSDLQRAVMDCDPHGIADMRAMVRALEPVFRARRWSGALWETGADSFVLRHLISGWGMGREAWQLAQGLVGKPVPRDQAPLLEQIVETGRGVFFDDVERLLGEAAERLEGATLADRLAHSLRARSLSRGAWAPVLTRRGVTHVLTVIGVDMTESDFAGVLLVANQLGAWLSMSELSAKLAHEEHRSALAEMSALVAHEIRAPALILDSTARRLEKQIHGDTRLEPSVALLRRQIGALDEMVAHLIDHGRTLNGLREASPVGRAIDRALAELELHPGMGRIDVRLPTPPPIVRADPLLLSHAIVELVQNAVQHSPDGSRVELSVEVHACADGQEARIAVTNPRAELDQEVSSRMFEPFFSTTGRTGIGLAVARRVAIALGGRLELDPRAEGVCMALWLPVEPRLLAPPARAARAKPLS